MVLCHAQTLFIQQTQIALADGIALIGGQTVPFGRFGMILFHADALGVAETGLVLTPDVALLSGFPVPAEGCVAGL